MAMKSDLSPGFSTQSIQDIPSSMRSYSWTYDGRLSITADDGVYLRDSDSGRWQLVVAGEHFYTAKWSRTGDWMAIATKENGKKKETVRKKRAS